MLLKWLKGCPWLRLGAGRLRIILGLPKSWWKSTRGPWLSAVAIRLVGFEGGIGVHAREAATDGHGLAREQRPGFR